MNNTNILKKLKPMKILGKGSEGVVILSHNENYAVKIYRKKPSQVIMFIKIINYLEDYNNIPKTIYKSYIITSNKNSLDRYIVNNNLPNYFSYKNENNLKLLSSKYKMDYKLFEIMKTYKITLEDFLQKLLNNKNIEKDNKINILNSLLHQGLLTLLWLYMKKGIVHGDTNLNNFFVEDTNDDFFNIHIKEFDFNIKLYGYYLIIADFGYAKSIELIEYYKYPYDVYDEIMNNSLHPWNDMMNLIKSFKKYYELLESNDLELNYSYISLQANTETSNDYKNMLKSYITNENLKDNIKIFKKNYFLFVINNIFDKNNEIKI